MWLVGKIKHLARKAGNFISYIHCGVKILEPWGILLAVIGLLLNLYSLEKDRESRRNQTINNAISIVTNAAYTQNSFGVEQALNVLKSEKFVLEGLTLNGLILRDINLENLELRRSNFSKTDFTYSKFSMSKMTEVNLQGANLHRVDFTRSVLYLADLRRAQFLHSTMKWTMLASSKMGKTLVLFSDLSGANLFNTDLRGANISGSDFRGALNLTRKQLESACVYEVESQGLVPPIVDEPFKDIKFKPCGPPIPLKEYLQIYAS